MGECQEVPDAFEIVLVIDASYVLAELELYNELAMAFKYLLKKEFRQFLRDPGMARIVMTFPILIVLVFPFAASMELRNIKLAVRRKPCC